MCSECQRREQDQREADRRMWQAIRRGLLAVVKAIDVRYGDAGQRQDRAA